MRPGKVPKTKIRRIRLAEARRLRLHRQQPGAGNPPLPMYAPHFYSHLVCLLQFCCPWVCSSCLVSVMNIDTVARPLWSPDELLFPIEFIETRDMNLGQCHWRKDPVPEMTISSRSISVIRYWSRGKGKAPSRTEKGIIRAHLQKCTCCIPPPSEAHSAMLL